MLLSICGQRNLRHSKRVPTFFNAKQRFDRGFEGYWHVEKFGSDEDARSCDEKKGDIPERGKLKIFVINGHGRRRDQLVPLNLLS